MIFVRIYSLGKTAAEIAEANQAGECLNKIGGMGKKDPTMKAFLEKRAEDNLKNMPKARKRKGPD